MTAIEELRCVIDDLTRQVREARSERDAMLADIKMHIAERDRWYRDLDSVAASLGVETDRARILACIERVRGDIARKDREWAVMRDERNTAMRDRDEALAWRDTSDAALAVALQAGHRTAPAGLTQEEREALANSRRYWSTVASSPFVTHDVEQARIAIRVLDRLLASTAPAPAGGTPTSTPTEEAP